MQCICIIWIVSKNNKAVSILQKAMVKILSFILGSEMVWIEHWTCCWQNEIKCQFSSMLVMWPWTSHLRFLGPIWKLGTMMLAILPHSGTMWNALGLTFNVLSNPQNNSGCGYYYPHYIKSNIENTYYSSLKNII